MKPTAFLDYTFLFTPDSNTWTSLYEFESDLAKFFSSKGLEAQILKTVEGGKSGKRILMIRATSSVASVAQKVPQPRDNKPATEQIRRVQTQKPTNSFKQYQERGVPRSFVNQDKRQPKPSFPTLGRTNRQKVRTP